MFEYWYSSQLRLWLVALSETGQLCGQFTTLRALRNIYSDDKLVLSVNMGE